MIVCKTYFVFNYNTVFYYTSLRIPISVGNIKYQSTRSLSYILRSRLKKKKGKKKYFLNSV